MLLLVCWCIVSHTVDVENKTTYIAYMKNILKFLLYAVNAFNIISCDVINY